jgi:two-component system sensor histidine kinase ChvG
MINIPKFPLDLSIGLRWKLVLLSGFLFAIPWLGWEYVWEMEKYLRQGQERTLRGTVSAVATALHERPKLFEDNASFLSTVLQGRDLYAYQIAEPVQLDGRLKDWDEYRQHSHHYGAESLIESHYQFRESSLNFNHMVGKFGPYLYAYFEVTDESMVLRGKNSRSVDNNDHLEIAIQTPDQIFQRYIVTTTTPGWFTAYRLDDTPRSVKPVNPEPRIQGQWLATPGGYNIELRIPLTMLGGKIGFAITDVDQPNTKFKLATVGTSDTRDSEQLGTVLVPSPEIEKIIKGLGHTSSRIWVVDQHQRVLARAGDIKNSNGPWAVTEPEYSEADGLLDKVKHKLLRPVYDRLLNRPSTDFIDELKDAALLEGSEISAALRAALQGTPRSQWRLTGDKRAVILSAAHPIWIEDQVMGAVIAEETTNGIRSLRNRALEKLFNIILTVMTLGTLALFIFASRISARIRKLRNEAEQVIDDQGRITTSIEPSTARDEIGDLSRSFADLVGRLGQYTNYLENMSSRLSHELRTPVAVVKSSLENLAMLPTDDEAKVYMERATGGLSRLTAILTHMSEATRLEQFLQTSDRVKFNLAEIVSACTEGYCSVYSHNAFAVDITADPLIVDGLPENIAQLMDKLITNAIEFSNTKDAIEVSVQRERNSAVLRVSNRGPCLPDEMQDRIFDAMVSVRGQCPNAGPHLGIGLHIARLITDYHKGQINAENLPGGEGVVISVVLPLSV